VGEVEGDDGSYKDDGEDDDDDRVAARGMSIDRRGQAKNTHTLRPGVSSLV
jgi:hypothetical protein